MDKQMIEEMAKDMLEYAIDYYPKDMSAFTETKLREQFYLSYLGYAQHLIKAGYRKIPENVDWLDGYKQGFKEGVQALQIQLKEQYPPRTDKRCTLDDCYMLDNIDE